MGVKRRTKRAAIKTKAKSMQGYSLAELKRRKKAAKRSPMIAGEGKKRRTKKKVTRTAVRMKSKSYRAQKR
jgi:hypothetical protein